MFVTVGVDKFIRFYSYTDPNEPRFLNSMGLANALKSCDFSPDGKYLCIGSDNGVFEVF